MMRSPAADTCAHVGTAGGACVLLSCSAVGGQLLVAGEDLVLRMTCGGVRSGIATLIGDLADGGRAACHDRGLAVDELVMDTPGVTSRLVPMMPSLKKPSMYSVASCISGVSRVQLPSSSIRETPNAHGRIVIHHAGRCPVTRSRSSAPTPPSPAVDERTARPKARHRAHPAASPPSGPSSPSADAPWSGSANRSMRPECRRNPVTITSRGTRTPASRSRSITANAVWSLPHTRARGSCSASMASHR